MTAEIIAPPDGAGLATPPQSVRLFRDVAVEMRDGTALATDVWLPDETAPPGGWPTPLQRIPYDKSSAFMSQHVTGMEIPRALEAGFAVVARDTRGRYRSAGRFTPFVHEAGDGAATIALGTGPAWSDDRVAMYGAS